MLRSLCTLALAGLAVVHAAPTRVEERDSLPTIKFPDATYRASGYNSAQDIYTFKNIRFAAPPTGDLRWAKPAAAPTSDTVQDGSIGNRCPQAAVNGLNVLGSNTNPLTAAIDQFLTNDLLAPLAESGGAEDCLFLDMYVPGKAVRGEATLPVLHWIYGGGYILGAKDQLQDLGLPFYDGSGLVSQSGNNFIFVGSNYRLGAFGFLAGKSMEEQGLPNAGLWDQRAAGEWIADNIHLVGGNADDVTVMGESAGAGSILHHITAAGGTMAPWFKKAILQSPAFQPMWDRQGALDTVFQQFLDLAGCSGKDLACLRAADSQTLITANTKLNQDAVEGSFIVGPSADGSYVRQLAALEYASGNYAKGLSSILVSHVASEATIFVDGNVGTDAAFAQFVGSLFPNYTLASGLNKVIEDYYPNVTSPGSPYADESDRVNALVRDSSFTCNARVLLDAFTSAGVPAYGMQYSVTPGWHATDLLPTFWSDGLASSPLGTALEVAVPIFTSFANKYKSYLTSFVRAGDPNAYRDKSFFSVPWTINWPTVGNAGEDSTAQQFGNVLDAGDLGFSLVNDDQDERDACGFWRDVLAAATIQGGYSPPGAVVGSKYQADTSGASAHYSN